MPLYTDATILTYILCELFWQYLVEMEDAAAFLVDTSDNMILSHRSSALVGSTLESAASDPLMQSVAEKLDAGDLETTILNGYQVSFEQVDASNVRDYE